MAWALHSPHLRRRTDRPERSESTTPAAGTEGTDLRRPIVLTKPTGLALVGLIALLTAAWGGIVPYVGPVFGYKSNGDGAWQWSLMHSLLYLAPGAVGVWATLVVFGGLARAGRPAGRILVGLGGLILFACGAWFVVGPAVWPIFYSSLVFTPATSSLTSFADQVGYNLGPGVVLAAAGGMALKAALPDRRREIAPAPEMAAAEAPAPTTVASS
jgi:hypothetical protein